MSYLNQIDFTAQVRDIFDAKGNRIPSEIGRGVYRDDTDELMAICGPGFKPVQHKDVVQPILDQLTGQGYDLELRNGGSRNALYDMRGKKGAWVSPKVSDNGAVMRTDIILGDFIEVPGQFNGHGLRTRGTEDLNFFRISILNSHNSKFAVKVNTDYLRLICFNGMTSPHFSAGSYGKHTVNFNVDGLNRQVENAIGMMDQDAERFAQMAQTMITSEQAVEMLKLTIAKLPNKPTGEAHFSEPLINKIMHRFNTETDGRSAWDLFNAVTSWSTHEKLRSNADAISGIVGRETKVAAMLRSKEWNEMLPV